jgi:Tol biopolymer transport system component
MQVDPNSGEARGRSRRITTGLGVIAALSATADGKELAVLRNDTQYQVFIADYDPSNNHLIPPRRLSLDGRGNVASAWTADSKAVLFFSNRTGSSTIYKQAVAQSVAEQLISGPGDRRLPRLSPDGAQF